MPDFHESLQRAFTMIDVHPEHHHALLFVATPSGVQAVYAQRLTGSWQYGIELGIAKDQTLDAEFELVKSW